MSLNLEIVFVKENQKILSGDQRIQFQHGKGATNKIFKICSLNGVKDKHVFPVTKGEDLQTVGINPVEVSLHVYTSYPLAKGQ